MSVTYNRPPLREAICEIRFSLAENLSTSQVDDFYEKVSSLFPEKAKGHNFFVKSGPKDDNPEEIEIEQKIEVFDRFLNNSTNTNLHLAPNGVLSFHQLEPYQSWEVFFPIIKEACVQFLETFGLTAIQRLGLRYVNEIIIPKENFKLENYFNYDLNFPIDDKIVSQQLNLVFLSDNSKDKINVKISEANIQSDEDKKFILDLDYYSSKNDLDTPYAIFEWCDNAHTEVEKYFESIISSKTKELFN